jgi:hypothetical protein
MTYSSEDDRLVIATLGRGIRYLEDAYRGACKLVNRDGENCDITGEGDTNERLFE